MSDPRISRLALKPREPRAEGHGYDVEVVSSEQAIWGLREEWEDLTRRCLNPNVFTTFGWIWAWWRAFGSKEKNSKPYLLTSRKDGQLAALAPFMLRSSRRAGGIIRKLEFVDLIYADHMDPPFAQDVNEQWQAIFRYLAAHSKDWDVMALRRLRAIAAMPQAVEAGLRASDLPHLSRPDEPYLVIDINGDWEDFYQSLPPGLRRSYRDARASRRSELREQGLRVRILEQPQLEPDLLKRLLELEAHRRIAGAPAAAQIGEAPPFFEDLIALLGPGGWLYVALLEDSEHLVAYELGFRAVEELWCYLRGYDASYAHLSPGTILFSYVVDYAFQHNCRAYDMLRGLEEYKQRLTQTRRAGVRFDVWNRHWRSRLAAAVYFGVRRKYYGLKFKLQGREVHPDL